MEYYYLLINLLLFISGLALIIIFINKKYIYFNQIHNVDYILDEFNKNLKNNERYTHIQIPYYDKNKSIYFNIKLNNWIIINYLDNIIEIFLYDKKNYNKFLEKNIYFNPFESLDNLVLDI